MWLIVLTLVALGSLLAHQVAYRVVAGDQAGALLDATGHDYLKRLPVGAVLAGVCLILGLVLAGADRVQARRTATVPAWLVAALPMIGFALQEHLERYAASGHVHWGASLEPTFVVGLLLQLPFAAAAYLLARLLLRAAAVLVAMLLDRPAPPSRAPRAQTAPGTLVCTPSGMRVRLAPRGPPSALVV